MNAPIYNDNYETCLRTYATLLIYPGEIDPQTVTQCLGIAPSHQQRHGDQLPNRKSGRTAPLNGWFLSSKDVVQSRDSRRHIDWILDQLTPKKDALENLKDLGCRIEISCYWCSTQGHGGPTLSPYQMKRLSELNLELWFDVYGASEMEDALQEYLGNRSLDGAPNELQKIPPQED